MNDLRFALRSLAKSPGFTVVAVLTLAFGIGATTAIFSILNAVVLRPLTLPRPDELVAVRCVIPEFAAEYPSMGVNARLFTEWQSCPAFSGLALIDRGRATLTGAGEPVQLSMVQSSTNLFSTLGVVPALGRAFAVDENKPGKQAVAVISDRLWRDRFGADPEILNRSITLNLQPITVIGVLPAGFRLPGMGLNDAPDFYVPRSFGAQELSEVIGMFNYEAIGRVASGASRTEAETQMNAVADAARKLTNEKTEVRAFTVPLQGAVVGDQGRGLWILLSAIAAVLLLACLNLSILGLARAETQSHEFAVRAALGASRPQLFGRALAESMILAVSGGSFGCLFAYWGLDALVALAPAGMPRLDEVRLDTFVLAFAIGTTLLTSLLAGVIPSWHAAKSDAASVLSARNSARIAGGAPRRMRQTLIGLEVAVGTVLLAIAALLIGSFSRLMNADVGFRAPNTVTTALLIPQTKYESGQERVSYYRRAIAAVSSVPGVSSAAVGTLLPLKGETWVDAVRAEGDTRPMMEQPRTNVRFISPEYFKTLGVPLLAGRSFRDDDQESAVVISAKLAATLWPGQDPLGRKLLRGEGSFLSEYHVVGVAGDVRVNADQQPVSILYRVFWAWPMTELSLAIRLEGSSTSIVPQIRRAIHSVDPDVPLQAFQTMGEIFDDAIGRRRFQMKMIAVFAFSALTLAGLGIYGVVAHSVSQRTRELGIRLTFGAQPSALRRMVLLQGMKPIAVGLLGGIAASMLGGKLLASFLYETSPHDPLALGAVAVVLLAVACFACWLPARRATEVNPIDALRAE